MVAPVVEWLEDDGSTEYDSGNPINHGNVDAGTDGTEIEVILSNNHGGTSDVATMENVRLTTVTKNGYLSGDTNANGKEIVEQKLQGIRNITEAESEYSYIGGTTVKTIDDIRGDKLLTPTNLVGVVSHANGGAVKPGSYYAKVSALDETGETLPSTESAVATVEAMISQATEDASSETIDTTTNTRIAQKITSSNTYYNGAALKMATGGTLVGNFRLETDNSGSPSGTLVHANAHLDNVTLTENALKYAFNLLQTTITDATAYWLVFEVVSGSGVLRGTTGGTADQVKYWNGSSWSLSSNVENLVYQILDDNQIVWDWDDTLNAVSYKIFRTTSRGSYGSSSLLASLLISSTYTDKLSDTQTGQPLATATVSYEHHTHLGVILSLPSDIASGLKEYLTRAYYQYQ